jgi:hypothetical protein
MVSSDSAEVEREVQRAAARVTVRHERTINVACYGGGTLYVEVREPGKDRPSARARLSVGDAGKVIAALEAASEAAAANIESHKAVGGWGRV